MARALRAIPRRHLDHEAMRIIQTIGMVKDFEASSAGYVEIAAVRFEPDAELRRKETSIRRQVRSRYVLAADGANSFVRAALDGGVVDLGFQDNWAVYDLMPFAPLGLEYNDAQICDPERPRCLFRVGDKIQRFEFMVLPGDDAARARPAAAPGRRRARADRATLR